MRSPSYSFDPYLNYGSNATSCQAPSIPVYFSQVPPQHVPYQPFMRYNAGTLSVPNMNHRNKRPIMDNGANTNENCVKKKNALIRSWTPSEDRVLLHLVNQYGPKWAEIAYILKTDFNINRLGKQCRERWCNHVNPNIKHGEWTPEEDECILKWQSSMGNRWARIAKMLNGRTENSVKNRFVSLLSKGLKGNIGGRTVLEKIDVSNQWDVPVNPLKLETPTNPDALQFLEGYSRENLRSNYSEAVPQMSGSPVMTLASQSAEAASEFFKNEHCPSYSEGDSLSAIAVSHFNSNFSPYSLSEKDGYSLGPSLSNVNSLHAPSSGSYVESSVVQNFEHQPQSHYENGRVDANRRKSSTIWDYMKDDRIERNFHNLMDHEQWKKHFSASGPTISTMRSNGSELSFPGYGPSGMHFQKPGMEPPMNAEKILENSVYHTSSPINATLHEANSIACQSPAIASSVESLQAHISPLEKNEANTLIRENPPLSPHARSGCTVASPFLEVSAQVEQLNDHRVFSNSLFTNASSPFIASDSDISIRSKNSSTMYVEEGEVGSSSKKVGGSASNPLLDEQIGETVEKTNRLEEMSLESNEGMEDAHNYEKDNIRWENRDLSARDLLESDVYHRYERPRRRYYTCPPVQSKFETKT
ncbi:Myb family Dna-binding domain-containing protein [Cardiosporidium cionae]|uniref:Myb family Dna-binding domain-containing protein n=1 Tax=Cardiosporidium cionae TaxID=476202 RepID=A0ABQ7J8V3_9APIC|nr:Myb family Dna-binding domain-containing protein [Cardiosporidium cionae]|eukprot:KAF8820090.1 Myb family Dna-binding domain-containing protein [Cardiosporidium cionae]